MKARCFVVAGITFPLPSRSAKEKKKWAHVETDVAERYYSERRNEKSVKRT